ncbi:unnamed protein product [Durusdinium trenchii]|uniref:Uncharacterized protein n=1 Tax=Durusdinium trenchii TaxID=1381693 RepID=A0ABP0J8L4_9DINO
MPSPALKGFEDLWSTPGMRFRQCPRSPRRRTLQLEMNSQLSDLRQKPKCTPGQALIGDFSNNAYHFTCCDAGEKCQGCRTSSGGVCQKCAAGYVMQTIPIMNTSKCFICDDVPNWRDMQGRSCSDLQKQGICSGGWPSKSQDVAFQGVRPSEVCCACGGGSVHPTPVQMPLQSKALYFGQSINETPEPITAEVQQADPACSFASSGLELLKDGQVSGTITVTNQTVIKCSTVSVQDPVRGIVTHIAFSLPVYAFSYGEQVVYFKFWGLDQSPTQRIVAPQSVHPRALTKFQLQCDPKCQWLSITLSGELHWNPIPSGTKSSLPEDLSAAVTTLAGMPSCSCQVAASLNAKPVSSRFLAVQARLWNAAAYEMPRILARVSAAIPEVQLLEDLGPGLRWFNRSGHSLALPVVENISSGEKVIVSKPITPNILDVDCSDAKGNPLTWSRSGGEVMLNGDMAFKLDPLSGTISGTPQLSLSSAQGRAEVNITCQLALGGPLYDMELPVVLLNVQIMDDVCWVPSNISGTFQWKETPNVQEAKCLQECRLRDDCAAIQYDNKSCRVMVGDGNQSFVDSQVLVRLNNCSEEDAGLNLFVPGAGYLEGEFSVMTAYHGASSYSRPGSNPDRQLLLGRRENVERVPASCMKSAWLLLHINSSDYEDSTAKNKPEFFGDAMACITPDVVSNVFKNGQDIFDLQLLPAELQSAPNFDKPAALQPSTLALSVPSCSKPAASFVYGTVKEPGIYSLDPCECFGEAYALVNPVTQESNAAVPRNADGSFNNGSVPDQLLFSGPYTCEESASVGQFLHFDLEGCQKACSSQAQCQFYLFGKTSETCTLFQSCRFIQDVGLQIVNELYGIPPKSTSYCRIANPQKCWQEIRRRSMLSFTPSALPDCLFQKQYDACDALQLLLGKKDGPCTRCEYIDASSPFAAQGLQKVPLPEVFPAASQITVTCNKTSRMFAMLEEGLHWKGRTVAATFTCVSGQWIGEGPWRDLSNFTCQRCIQVGSPSLQRFSMVSMPEIYFLEHRQVQVNYPLAWKGCPRAGFLTPSPLQSARSKMFMVLAKNLSLQLSSSSPGGLTWWIDTYTEQLRVSSSGAVKLDPNKTWCVCDTATQPGTLYACPCTSTCLVMERGFIQGSTGKCARALGQTLKYVSCPMTRDIPFLWYFQSGNCFFGFDLSNTAKRLWTATSEAATSPSASPLRLGNYAFKMHPIEPQGGLFQIYMDYPPYSVQLCLHADMSQKNGTGFAMKISGDCQSVFMWIGQHLIYFHRSDLSTTYYMALYANPTDLRQILVAEKQTKPGDRYNFKMDHGQIFPVGEPTKCLQASQSVALPMQETTYLVRHEFTPNPNPPYPLCDAYPAFFGDPLQGARGWYQVCATSPFLKLQPGPPPEILQYDEYNVVIKCPKDSVMSKVKWPQFRIYPPPLLGLMDRPNLTNGQAACVPVETIYLQRAASFGVREYKAKFIPYNINNISDNLTFVCPPGSLMQSISIQAFAWNSMTFSCIGPWETLVAPPSSLSSAYFENCSQNWTQSWSTESRSPNSSSSGDWMELGSCETSLSVAMPETPNPNADARPLDLKISNLQSLSSKERAAYTRAPAIHIAADNAEKVLFTCLPGHAEGPLLGGNRTTLCASNAAVKVSDLSQASALFVDQFQTLWSQKSCPVLMKSATVGDITNTAKGGMTMAQLTHILRLAYHATAFGDPHAAPFNYTGQGRGISECRARWSTMGFALP